MTKSFEEVVKGLDGANERVAIADLRSLRAKELAKSDTEGMNLLHHVARKNCGLAVVKALVKKLKDDLGAKKARKVVDALDNEQRSVLCTALTSRNTEVSLFLLDTMGVEALGGVEGNGWSCLAYACEYSMEEVALKLIEKLPQSELIRKHHNAALRRYGCGFARGNAASNGDPICGGTPLHFAVRTNLTNVVEALLERYEREHVEKGDKMDRPAEALAALRGHDDLVRLLWEKAPLRGDYWTLYSAAGRTTQSNIRQFFRCYRGALGEELVERLFDGADEALLRELLCCAILAKSPDMVRAVVSRLSQAAIDEPLLDGISPRSLCEKMKEETLLPLLQKCGPKSAAC